MPPSRDDSIFNEPHMKAAAGIRGTGPTPAEKAVEPPIQPPDPALQSLDERLEHSIWNEPTISDRFVPNDPRDRIDYQEWLDQRRERTSALKSWSVTLLICLVAGPASIASVALVDVFDRSLLMLVVFGPVAEELAKNLIGLYVAEKRPYLFKSSGQILLCSAMGGLVFALIENLLYLHVYIENPSPGLVLWRYTICVALHMICAVIAGLGVRKLWLTAVNEHKRPDVSSATPYFAVAATLHGLYNLMAVTLDFSGVDF